MKPSGDLKRDKIAELIEKKIDSQNMNIVEDLEQKEEIDHHIGNAKEMLQEYKKHQQMEEEKQEDQMI